MDEMEEIQKRVVRHPDAVDLYIKRLPSKTRDLFVEFANKYFVGDYGFTMKSIVDQFLVIGPQIELIMQNLDDVMQRVEALEGKKLESAPIQTEQKKFRTLKRKEEIKNE